MKIIKYGKKHKLADCHWFEFTNADKFSINERYKDLCHAKKVWGRITDEEQDQIDYEYDEARNLVDEYFNPCHDENIYGLASIEQSIAESKQTGR